MKVAAKSADEYNQIVLATGQFLDESIDILNFRAVLHRRETLRFDPRFSRALKYLQFRPLIFPKPGIDSGPSGARLCGG